MTYHVTAEAIGVHNKLTDHNGNFKMKRLLFDFSINVSEDRYERQKNVTGVVLNYNEYGDTVLDIDYTSTKCIANNITDEINRTLFNTDSNNQPIFGDYAYQWQCLLDNSPEDNRYNLIAVDILTIKKIKTKDIHMRF